VIKVVQVQKKKQRVNDGYLDQMEGEGDEDDYYDDEYYDDEGEDADSEELESIEMLIGTSPDLIYRLQNVSDNEN
jgi:hypothetical protein